jgi:hypothetical protein
VKKNVIAALLPVAGLAVMASAQTSAPVRSYTNAFGTMEIRWAVDGDGRNAEAANPLAASLVNLFPAATLVPGAQSSAVGLTLQARIATTAANSTIPSTVTGQGNYGIGRVSFGTSNSYNRIKHNDSVSNAYTGGLSRGQTTLGDVGTGSITSLPTDGYALFGATSQFRSFIGGYGSSRTNTNNWNSANGNAVANQNIRSGNAQTSGSGITNNANLNGSSRARLANGFQEQAGQNGQTGTTLAAFDASVNTNISGDVASNFTDLGNNGAFSPWVNIYRVVFNPRPNAGTDLARNVTVTFNGNVQYISAVSYNPDINATLLRVDSFLGTATDAVATATFTVPTPATAALLGLGGLMAARRRRA